MSDIEPLVHLSGWLKGCDCHEEQLRRGECVECQWKAVRGRCLAAKLNETLSVLSDIRERLPSDMGPVASHEVAWSIGRAMADLSMKFHWVHEPPYLIWQAVALVDVCCFR